MIDDLLAWTGWVIGFIGLVMSWISMRDAKQQRQRSENLTQTLARAARTTVLGQPVSATDGDLRSVLIRVAAAEGDFDTAVKAAAKFGGGRPEVERLALQLRDNGLLKFDDPVDQNPQLSLAR